MTESILSTPVPVLFQGGTLDGTTQPVAPVTHWFKVPFLDIRRVYVGADAPTSEVTDRFDMYERVSPTCFVWRYRR